MKDPISFFYYYLLLLQGPHIFDTIALHTIFFFGYNFFFFIIPIILSLLLFLVKLSIMVKVEIDKICLEIIFSNLITRLVVQVMLLIQLEHGIRYIYIEREREI